MLVLKPSRHTAHRVGHRRPWAYRFLPHLAVSLLAVLAFNTLALDHYYSAAEPLAAHREAAGHDHEHLSPEDSAHLQHCHLSPGSCSDQPLAPTWAQLGELLDVFPSPDLLQPVPLSSFLRLVEAHLPPPDKPPIAQAI